MENNITQNKDMEKPNYFITFPSYLLKELSPQECVLCGLLTSLSKTEGYAFPSNKMLAETMSCSTETIQRVLLKLETNGYIIRESDNGVGRKIWVTSKMIGGNLKSEVLPHVKNDVPPPQILNPYIYTNNNNKDISKDNKLVYTDEFNTLWDLYLKVGNKMTAFNVWSKMTTADKKAVAEHIPSYIQRHKETSNLSFIPHLTTYLRQRRWADELPYGSDKVKELTNVSWD